MKAASASNERRFDPEPNSSLGRKAIAADLIKSESRIQGRESLATVRAKDALECGGLTPVSTIADSMIPRQLDELPVDFPVGYFQPGDAWRRASVGPRYAAGIEKQNATASFVAWDVRVAVQENIDIIRWVIRRNMLQAES
jgi:hypothetical protein